MLRIIGYTALLYLVLKLCHLVWGPKGGDRTGVTWTNRIRAGEPMLLIGTFGLGLLIAAYTRVVGPSIQPRALFVRNGLLREIGSVTPFARQATQIRFLWRCGDGAWERHLCSNTRFWTWAANGRHREKA